MPTVETLVGRESEQRTIHELVDGVAEHGGALVLRGEPGIGKSALLAEASRYATSEGLSVLAATGAQSEARLPFAGLHQLLQPVLDGADELPLPQRDALCSAFGMEAKPADAFLIALGALELLSEHAARSPVLVVVEDAHWVDDPTGDVVSFIARRIEAEPIALLIATREDGQPSEAGLQDVQLLGLTDVDAGALLDSTAPDLAPEVRRRLLDEARGNPLALVELPKALAYEQLHGQELLPELLPLSDRLERAFATRFADLPAETRRVLVFAAADDGGVVEEVLGAAGSALEALEPAVTAGLVEVDRERLRFHHPLVRSAIYQEAGPGERQAAHAALALEVAADPDRSVWHRAAATVGPDDQLAGELLQAAHRARNRGAPAAAITALERAAELTVDEEDRGGLFIEAAEAEWELGRTERSTELLAKAKPLPLRSYERLRLAYLAEVFDDQNWTGASRAAAFAELAKELMEAGRPRDAIRALEVVAVRSYWGNPDQETRDLIVDAADGLPISKDNAELLFVLANADTLRQGARVLRALTSRRPVPTTPDELLALAASAYAVWSFDVSMPFVEQAVDGLRAQGRLGPLAQALTFQAWTAVQLANAPLALTAADEAIALAAETRQSRWSLAARMAKATILAERGQLDEAEQMSAEVEAALLQTGASQLLALVQFTRGRGAVSHQQYAEGRDHLERIFDAADMAYHPLVGALGLADLVDACVHLGDLDGAAGYLAQLESLVGQVPGTLLLAQLAYARALVADDEETYQEGLSTPLATWPCYRGRLLLAYGSWLRRQRRVAESRAPLRAAKEIFDGLGFVAVGELARQELRASGETSRRRAPEAWNQLSPQELQIARMAAEGLTNREIGQKLFLSHRTVGSHLYRMFPKLGVTSRGQLAAALQSSD